MLLAAAINQLLLNHAKSLNRKKRLLLAGGLALLLTVFCSCGKKSNDSGASGTTTKAPAESGEFEGVIEISGTTPDAHGLDITYYIKGGRARFETKPKDNPKYASTEILDFNAGKMTTLIPAQKMYMTMDLKEAREEMMKNQPGAADQGFPKLTDTGKKETIVGHECEHYLIGDKQDLDVCLAKGLGYFAFGGPGGPGGELLFSPKQLEAANSNPEWKKILTGGAFPLKMTTLKDGAPIMSMQVTQIDRKSVDDSLFTVPADYKPLPMAPPPSGHPPTQ